MGQRMGKSEARLGYYAWSQSTTANSMACRGGATSAVEWAVLAEGPSMWQHDQGPVRKSPSGSAKTPPCSLQSCTFCTPAHACSRLFITS